MSLPEVIQVCGELGLAVGSPKWRRRIDRVTSLGALHRSEHAQAWVLLDPEEGRIQNHLGRRECMTGVLDTGHAA